MFDPQIYILPLDYAPNPDYVNVPPNYEYLAWRLSVNPQNGTSVWMIQQVAETPTVPIESLLPEGDVTSLPIGGSNTLQSYGYSPSAYPSTPLTTTLDTLEDQTLYVRDELLT